MAVRMALHTGEAELRDEGNYVGPDDHPLRALRALAHGGQVLVSRQRVDLVADGCRDGVDLARPRARTG